MIVNLIAPSTIKLYFLFSVKPKDNNVWPRPGEKGIQGGASIKSIKLNIILMLSFQIFTRLPY